jgi:hypothetical protein
MKKDIALKEIELAKHFYIEFYIGNNLPLTIKINKKKLKNLVARFNSEDTLNIYKLYITEDFQPTIHFVITINY